MTYEVSLTKWRGLALVACTCCLAAMLFVGGVLVGVGLWMPTLNEIALAKEYQQKQQAATQAKAKPAPPAAPPAAVKAVPAPAAPADPASTPAVTTAAAEPAPATAPAPAPQAETAAADATASPFVLQVGSFRDAKNAQQLQAELNGKGYQAAVLNTLDSEQRMWHVVRIGHYQDLASAAQEAATIGQKEQIQALIMRGGKL